MKNTEYFAEKVNQSPPMDQIYKAPGDGSKKSIISIRAQKLNNARKVEIKSPGTKEIREINNISSDQQHYSSHYTRQELIY